MITIALVLKEQTTTIIAHRNYSGVHMTVFICMFVSIEVNHRTTGLSDICRL